MFIFIHFSTWANHKEKFILQFWSKVKGLHLVLAFLLAISPGSTVYDKREQSQERPSKTGCDSKATLGIVC